MNEIQNLKPECIWRNFYKLTQVPRIGEFTRCGVMKRWEGISFSRALGTVVTERMVDMLLMLAIVGTTLLLEMSTFGTFFRQTGTNIGGILSSFSWAGWVVTAVCLLAIGVLLHLLLRNLSIYNKVKTTLSGIWEGVVSLKSVRSLPLFVLMTVGIWLCYFLHYYLTFFCFDFTPTWVSRVPWSPSSWAPSPSSCPRPTVPVPGTSP